MYPDVALKTLTELEHLDIVGRIWRADHTLWKPQPTEIANRLGWLRIMDLMVPQIPSLESFAREIRGVFHHVVLLGMGGSSLGPEVLRQTFGSRHGYPELIVLDSVLPDAVRAVRELIDPSHTLFLVSSKSGTTIEVQCLWSYFREQVQLAADRNNVGQNFVAITDPGTPLEKLAKKEGFRRTFLNPPDIGGRYSVLSYFGLVPAALMGLNLTTLIKRAQAMRKRCAAPSPIAENPGAALGAYIGALAITGRDKLTIVTSPAISSIGLWVEQLLAESTGKEGKGIIPVIGEPLVEPDYLGNDRVFVCLRLRNDDNSGLDKAMERIAAAGHPVITLTLHDRYDLAAEFYRWEFATAVAGVVLDINPFDQPDVQKTKEATERLLARYTDDHRPTTLNNSGSIQDLLTMAGEGKYLAIMAYLRQTLGTDQALAELRRAVVEKHHIATTLGYGPRFLHSTGQLHKGGPDTGLFLQLTGAHEKDLPIPGRLYTFGTMADAQAEGDFQTLQAIGRRVIRVHLDNNSEKLLGFAQHFPQK